jgi:hypothetical protein
MHYGLGYWTTNTSSFSSLRSRSVCTTCICPSHNHLYRNINNILVVFVDCTSVVRSTLMFGCNMHCLLSDVCLTCKTFQELGLLPSSVYLLSSYFQIYLILVATTGGRSKLGPFEHRLLRQIVDHSGFNYQ